MKRQAKSTGRKPPPDLKGMRFGKWKVLKSAGPKVYFSSTGERFLQRMWLCRCECGVQKEVQHNNLIEGRTTQCQQCQHIRHGISSTKTYERWRKLRQSGELPKEWHDFDAFRKAIGDPPDKEARLTRYDRTKPHSSRNTFWIYPALLQNDAALVQRIQQSRKKATEERLAHAKLLVEIRNAKDRKERERCMIAARKAGYSFRLIGMAANVTRQRAHIIVTTKCR